ncbi:hypothetical protein IB274_29340 [Pseudomonas sp. PDM18]|uniref:hypothetical protein n=1 Tax=Pseudomonas sp. NPDC086581 TaxID=3364432 RepID=UPI00198D2EBD|nr:hypothetical protein [Pseudomonas sp. PDM18]
MRKEQSSANSVFGDTKLPSWQAHTVWRWSELPVCLTAGWLVALIAWLGLAVLIAMSVPLDDARAESIPAIAVFLHQVSPWVYLGLLASAVGWLQLHLKVAAAGVLAFCVGVLTGALITPVLWIEFNREPFCCLL